MAQVQMQSAIGLAFAATAAWLGATMPSLATPRAAIAVVEVLGPGNPEQVAVRDGTFSTEISIGAAQGASKDQKLTDQAALQQLKLGDELAVAVQSAFKAKGVVAYIAGADPHPWPTSSLQLSIDDTRYERRLEEHKIGPNLLIRYRLYDATSRDRLIGDTYIYDMYAKTLGRSILRPPAEFTFDKPEDLKAHPEVILAALRKGIDMIAEQIVTDIMADIDE
jgi:hypothetical protein